MGLTRGRQGAADSGGRREPPPPPLETKPAITSSRQGDALGAESEDDDDDGGGDGCANQWGDDADRGPAPPVTSRLVALTRELKALEVRYFRMRLQLEKAAEQNSQLRADMAKLRGLTTKRERETCQLRNLIDRIQSEKKQSELQAAASRAYAKKIEQRVFLGTKGQSIVQCNVDLGNQVRALEKAARDQDAAAQRQRLDLQDAHEKLRVLRRALEMRFEDLALNGSLHTGILFELTRLQDQNASLALQLADDRTSAKALQRQLAAAHAKEAELDDALLVREAMLASLERERAALDAHVAALRSEQQTFAFEKATLLKFIQEQAEVKFALDARAREAQEAKVAALEALHHKLQLAMDDKAQAHDALRAASGQCERLQLECHAARRSVEDEQQQKRELEARERELERQNQHLGDAASKAEDDFKAARAVCRELQDAVGSYERETRELRARVDELERQVAELRQTLAHKQSEELALRAAMESALRDLEALSKQRNDAARAMNEAVTLSASSLDEQQALEAALAAQRQQLAQLKHAKSLLQNAMLEQLAALRKQLQLERVQRIEAEAKVKQLVAFASPSKRSAARRQQPREELHGAADVDEPKPLPPPTMTGAPSPLPAYLSSLGRLPPDASSASSDSGVDSDDDDDGVGVHAAPVQPRRALTLQLPTAPAVPLEHRVVHAQPPEDHISLLELAGGDGGFH